MEPLTLILIGLGLYAASKKKAATPAAAAATVSQVDQIAAAIVAGQNNKLLDLRSILSNQIKALGFTLSGVGHPPDANGVGSDEFIISSPAVAPFSVAQGQALSTLWHTITYAMNKANLDKNITQDEALDIAKDAQNIASMLYDMSVQKKTSQI